MILLLLASLIWAFSFGLIGQRLKGLDPAAVAAARLLISAICFVPFLRRTRPRMAVALAGLGAVQFGLMYLAYIASFRWLPSHAVALLTVFTPIYVAGLDDLRRGSFRARILAAALLAVAGAAVCTWNPATWTATLSGFALVQVSNVCFAVGQLGYRRLLQPSAAPTNRTAMAWMYLGALAVTLPAAGWQANQATWSPSWSQLGVIAYLGAIASGLGFYLWNGGARRVDTGTLAVFNNVKIPLAVAVSLGVFGETVEPLRLLGSVTLMAAALALTQPRRGLAQPAGGGSGRTSSATAPGPDPSASA